MLARVADCLYWMNRYLERAEFTARLVRLQVQRLPVGAAAEIARGWRLIFQGLNMEPPGAEALGGTDADDFLFADGYTLTDLLTFETGSAGSITSCLSAARENARQVRGRIGADAWSCLNRDYLQLRRVRLVDIWKREPELLYRDLIEGAQRFHGICDTAMRHGEAWCFMRLGRYIERAQLVGSMLQAHCRQGAGSGADEGDWPVLLHACNAFEAYGHAHGGVIDPHDVVRLLADDAELPYSLRFCLERQRESLSGIDPSTPDECALILDRLDDLLGPLGRTASGHTPRNTSDLERISHLFLALHDALARQYVYYPVDA